MQKSFLVLFGFLLIFPALAFAQVTGYVTPQQYDSLAGSSPTHECTAAFQSAVNSGQPVFVPPGSYLISGASASVTVPDGVEITGVSSHGTIQYNPTGVATFGAGSIIYVTNTSFSPFIYNSGDHFSGLTFYYPNQPYTASAPNTPTYPPTFAHGSVPSITQVAWDHIGFVNPYIGIEANVSHGTFTIEDIDSSAIYRTLELDGGGGTDSINHIRIGAWFYWCPSGSPINAWTQANGVGLYIGRSDAIAINDVYVSGQSAGFNFVEGSVNEAWGVYGTMHQVATEGNNYGLYIQSTQGPGLTITNHNSDDLYDGIAAPYNSNPLEFTLNGGNFWAGGGGPIGGHISLLRPGTVNIHNANFWPASASAYSINVVGTSFNLTVNGCIFGVGGVGLGTVVPIYSSTSFNTLILTGNNFNTSPNLAALPATTYRYSGNIHLADH